MDNMMASVRMLQRTNLYPCICNWSPVRFPDMSFDPHMNEFHVFNEGFSVVFPESTQCTRGWKLAAVHFDGDFKRVTVKVVVILHPPSNVVPFCTICNTIHKIVSTTNFAGFRHRWMISRIGLSNIAEDIVIRTW